MEIGQFIKATRKSKRIKKKELAKQLGISYPTITHLENNENVGVDVLKKVCEVLGLEIDIRVKLSD